jgi:ketosteroid isomerase-like protein
MSVSDSFCRRLRQATNDHDLEALVACFTEDYRNDTPAHPARSFSGRAHVRKNWETIFAAVPDLTADVNWISDEGTVWSEWEFHGTRRDGSLHLMRGVVIFELAHGLASSARFYVEPVDPDPDPSDVDQAVQRQVLAAEHHS